MTLVAHDVTFLRRSDPDPRDTPYWDQAKGGTYTLQATITGSCDGGGSSTGTLRASSPLRPSPDSHGGGVLWFSGHLIIFSVATGPNPSVHETCVDDTGKTTTYDGPLFGVYAWGGDQATTRFTALTGSETHPAGHGGVYHARWRLTPHG